MDSTDVSVTMALETDGSPVLGFNHREFSYSSWAQQGQLGISRGKGRTFLRTLSTQLVNISRDGGSTTSLDDFWQYSVALTVKKIEFILMFKWNFLYFPGSAQGQDRWGMEQPGLVESVPMAGE